MSGAGDMVKKETSQFREVEEQDKSRLGRTNAEGMAFLNGKSSNDINYARNKKD